MIYDTFQAWKAGPVDYLSDGWNYVDMSYSSLGFFNLYMQYYVGTINIYSKIVLMIVVLICLLKTFFFMRILTIFSHLVKRVIYVMVRITNFLLFFTMLIVMFAAIFNVIRRNE